MGVVSPQEIGAEDAKDAYVRATEKADFAAFVQKLAKERGVPESSIFLPAGQTLPSTPSMAAAIGEKTGEDAAAAQKDSTPSSSGRPALDRPRMRSVRELMAGPRDASARRATLSAARMSHLANLRRKMGDTTRTAEETTTALEKLALK